jgi:hypothetical protein
MIRRWLVSVSVLSTPLLERQNLVICNLLRYQPSSCFSSSSAKSGTHCVISQREDQISTDRRDNFTQNGEVKSDLKSEVSDPIKNGNAYWYERSQQTTIRLMLGISAVNFYVWSAVLFNHIVFAGKVADGIDLGSGDPMFGYLGCGATFLIAYFTRHFANHAVYQSYLTKDKKRFGFQVHNVLGLPGRVFEIPVGNAKALGPILPGDKELPVESSRVAFLLRTNYVPIKADGVSSNLLIERDGILDLSSEAISLLSQQHKGTIDQKETRKEWRKNTGRKENNRKDNASS